MTRPIAEFPANYAEGRARFRALGARLGWSLDAHLIPGKGPNGEELTIDAAISSNKCSISSEPEAGARATTSMSASLPLHRNSAEILASGADFLPSPPLRGRGAGGEGGEARRVKNEFSDSSSPNPLTPTLSPEAGERESECGFAALRAPAHSDEARAERVLVVSSGLHGAEGPFGSAVQLNVMEQWLANGAAPVGVRCVFLHALNPYGYAWGRRVDADNADPNRNFLLVDQPYVGSPDGYKHFDALLNPKSPPGRFNFFAPHAWMAVLRHGLPALKQALVAGQYDFPQGIFFGGHEPTATHIALRDRLRGWIGPASDVVHLDFHSGLGPWGNFKLLLDSPVTPNQRDRLDRWFGPNTYEEDDPRKTSYLPRGGLGPWCVAQDFANEYLYLVAEFGTYGNITMLSGLRQENRAVHWGQPGERFAERARTRLRELFCPNSPAWRARVLTSGVDLVNRAAVGLASPIARS